MVNYKIYIHGRPQGQDIWPQCENANDSHYLNSFLDSGIGSKVDAVLQTDIWQGNAYYTYLRRKNVVEKIARGGSGSSYFAITVRFDKSFCRNVNSLYNLLNLVYNNLCNERFVRTSNGNIQYLINRFEEQNDLLAKIHNIVGDNLAKVIAPYIDDIKESKDTIGKNPVEYALQDVDSPSFVENMLIHKLVVSTEYVSLVSQVQPLKTQNANLTTELNTWKNNANTLQHDKTNLQSKISGLEDDNKRLEEKLSTASENAAKLYSSQLKTQAEELKQLRTDVENKDQTLKSVQAENERLRRENEEAAKNKEISNSFEQIKEPLIKFARLVASRFPENTPAGSPQDSDKSVSMDKIKTWIPMGTFILVLCAVGLCVYSSFICSPNGKNSSDFADSIKTKNEIIFTLNNELDSLRNLTGFSVKESGLASGIPQIIDITTLINQKIDVDQASGGIIKKDDLCNITLKNGPKKVKIPEFIELYANGQKLTKTQGEEFDVFKYTPTDAGKLKIECKIGYFTLSNPPAREFTVNE